MSPQGLGGRRCFALDQFTRLRDAAPFAHYGLWARGYRRASDAAISTDVRKGAALLASI